MSLDPQDERQVLEGQIIMVESENCKLRNALYDAAASFLIICQQAERIEDSDDASEIRHLASSSHQSAIEAIESPREVFAQRIAQLERENAALRGALDAATTSLCAISQHYREKVEKLERENAALREDNLKAHQIACAAGLERDRLRDELAALRHSEENLAATVRGLEFELEKAEKATAMLRGTVEALGDANDRLTIEISGLRKAALALINEIDEKAFYRDALQKGEILYEHVGPLRAALDAARAKEGGAT